jgi:hypothetical protein
MSLRETLSKEDFDEVLSLCAGTRAAIGVGADPPSDADLSGAWAAIQFRRHAPTVCAKCGASFPKSAWGALRLVCGGSTGSAVDGVVRDTGQHESRLCVCGATLERDIK